MPLSIVRPVFTTSIYDDAAIIDNIYCINNDPVYKVFNLSIERSMGKLNEGLNDVYQELLSRDQFYLDIAELTLKYAFSVREDSDSYRVFIPEFSEELHYIFDAYGFSNFIIEEKTLRSSIFGRQMQSEILTALSVIIPKDSAVITVDERVTFNGFNTSSTLIIKTANIPL